MTLAVTARGAALSRLLDDHWHLEGVLRLAGCDADSDAVTRKLLDEGGSLGGALALSDSRLGRLGVEPGVARNLSLLQAAQTAVLRRRAGDRPLIGDLDAVLDYLHATMAYLQHEVFRVLFLDSRSQLIRDEVMGRGTVDRCPVYPREIVARALQLAASRLVLVHNHPSGVAEPSRDDIAMTKHVVAAAESLDISVDDHLIIGRGGHFSFRGAGLIFRN